MLPPSFFTQDAVTLAQALLGCELIHATDSQVVAGIIVETEAYRQDDQASHSFRGQTQRNSVMFGPAGHLYVYFTYGMHYCCNIVGGGQGSAEAVLLRALQPTQGLELMQKRRHTDSLHNLCSGPAKLVQALGLGPADNGVSVTTPRLHLRPRHTTPIVIASPRIGIRQATDKPWRFFVAKNPHITKHLFNN
jgi:DNA-3-methyladenine glycosylase